MNSFPVFDEWKAKRFAITDYNLARQWLMQHKNDIHKILDHHLGIPDENIARSIVACLLATTDANMYEKGVGMGMDNLLVSRTQTIVDQSSVTAEDVQSLAALLDLWKASNVDDTLKWLKNDVVLAKIHSNDARYAVVLSQIRAIGGDKHAEDAEYLWSREWS